jgi:anti-anti-sigma factor
LTWTTDPISGRLTKERPAPTARVELLDGEALLVLEGEFDIASVQTIRCGLDRAIATGQARVVVDLGGVPFADTTVVRALIDARATLAAEGRWLRTRHACPQVARLLELSRAEYGILL